MLTVVGGIGYVSGGLFGGVLFGVGFLAFQNTFDKLGVDHASLEGLFSFLARFTTVLPALMGVSMGKNPSGAVSDMVVNFEPLKKVKRVLVPGLALIGVVYVLAWQEVISNWWFIVFVAVVIVALPAVGKLVDPEAFGVTREHRDEDAVPPELVGIDRPFTPADREWLDRELHLPAAAAVAAAPTLAGGRGVDGAAGS
jgi:hypothetical protein